MDTPSTDAIAGLQSLVSHRSGAQAPSDGVGIARADRVVRGPGDVCRHRRWLGAGIGNVPVAAAGPSCVFTGPAIGAAGPQRDACGESINLNCKNFPANHPYLLVEASLLVAIDPAASATAHGQATSVPGLLAIIAAFPS